MPVIVTDVPPAVVPLFGETLVTVGVVTSKPICQASALAADRYYNGRCSSSPRRTCRRDGVLFVTTTSVAAAAPNVTAAPAAKFVPVIVTDVPPAVVMLFGETLVSVGTSVPPDGVRKATICMIHLPEPSGAVAL